MPDNAENSIRYMTITEAAAYLGRSPDTIRRAVKQRKINFQKRNDGAYLIAVDINTPPAVAYAAATQAPTYAPAPQAYAADQSVPGQDDSLHKRLEGEIERQREQIVALNERLADTTSLLRQFHDAFQRERAAWREDREHERASSAAREADLRAELDRTRSEAAARLQEARADADRERQERLAAEERHRQVLAAQEQRHVAALADQEERHRGETARLWGEIATARFLVEQQQPMTPKQSRLEPKPASRGWLSKLTGR